MIGIAAWALLLPTASLIRRSPALAQSSGSRAALPQVSARDALRSPQFAILALTYFFSCATHSGPLFHTVSYAMTCGLSVTAAVSIYSVEGASGLFGRVVFGLLGDRFGGSACLPSGCSVQALAAGPAMFPARSLSLHRCCWFLASGRRVMPLYAALMRENFPLPIMGTMVGAGSMASSLAWLWGRWPGG